jgi:hypothetical protein
MWNLNFEASAGHDGTWDLSSANSFVTGPIATIAVPAAARLIKVLREIRFSAFGVFLFSMVIIIIYSIKAFIGTT